MRHSNTKDFNRSDEPFRPAKSPNALCSSTIRYRLLISACTIVPYWNRMLRKAFLIIMSTHVSPIHSGKTSLATLSKNDGFPSALHGAMLDRGRSFKPTTNVTDLNRSFRHVCQSNCERLKNNTGTYNLHPMVTLIRWYSATAHGCLEWQVVKREDDGNRTECAACTHLGLQWGVQLHKQPGTLQRMKQGSALCKVRALRPGSSRTCSRSIGWQAPSKGWPK